MTQTFQVTAVGVEITTAYRYDPNRNLLSLAESSNGAEGSPQLKAISYEYDAFGRQISAVNGDEHSVYAYRPDGLCLSKTADGITTGYSWEGQSIGMELGEDGQVIDKYTYGVGLLKSLNKGWYLYNVHGDVVQLIDNMGAIVREYSYDAFGNEINPSGSDSNPYRYGGYYFDEETGSYYLLARNYLPIIGRFTQQDTHWNTYNMIYGDNPQKINERQDAQGLTAYTYVPQISAIMQRGNLYVYCVNSPVAYRDSTGEALINAVCAAIGALAGWAFGDFVAKNLELEGWKYWTVRAAVTVGGTAIGWVAGRAITSAVASFLTANPANMLSLAHKLGPSMFSTAMKFLGINPALLINDSGKFYGLLRKAFNVPHVQVGYEWEKALIQKAQQLGISVRLDAPHNTANNKWVVWHLNIGKFHVAIDPKIIDTIREQLGGK